MLYVGCCTYCTGESFSQVEIEADSNDITERPHDDKPRPCVCTVCDKRFTTKVQLNSHKQLHTREKLYLCGQCKKEFGSRKCWDEHMNAHGTKYKCTECGKCLQGKSQLTAHKRIHSGVKPFECNVCSKRFTTSGNLVVHSRIHSGEKPYKCHLCDKAFRQSSHLNIHIRVHARDKPYKCSLCDKSFSEFGSLQTHRLRLHSNRRPYDCRYCGKIYYYI